MNENISKAVARFRSSPNLGDDEIYRALVGDHVESRLAARLVEFVPMVYCRLILRDSGARFSDSFRRMLPDGKPQELPLSSEPVWNAALAFARAEMERGISGKDLLVVAARSAEFDAANKLLQEGSKLERVAFTSPVLPWPEVGPEAT